MIREEKERISRHEQAALREKAVGALIRLGAWFRQAPDEADFARTIEKAQSENPWFTPQNIRFAMRQWGRSLTEEAIRKWSARYPCADRCGRVLLVLAGNIPMVGLHDILCTYLSGHRALIKTSRDDTVLIKAAVDFLQETEPDLADRLLLSRSLEHKSIDAVIATGSDQARQYFEYYFRDTATLLRHARYSIGVVGPDTSDEQLELLADDMMLYFGLGCRNVSLVLVPQDFDMNRLCRALGKYADVAHHARYRNNYDYRRAIQSLSDPQGVYDTGFLLLVPREDPALPIGMAGYRRYDSREEALALLDRFGEKLQCVVGDGFLPWGSAQRPALDEYADGVDTMAFLRSV